MSPEDRDLGYVWDMHEASQDILEFTRGMTYAEYTKNKLLRRAVERELEIMGEAARQIGEPFKKKYSDIPWRQAAALRNILAHEYGEVKQEIVYAIVINRMPLLSDQLKKILIEHGEL